MIMEQAVILILIILSVSINSAAQIVWKKGTNRLQKKAGIVKMLLNPRIIIGLGMYAVSALIWIIVLSNTEVSYAFPFISLGYVITTVLSYLILNEKLKKNRLIGLAIIIVGVIIVGLSL